MKLKMKKHKLLTKEKLGEYPSHKYGYYDYDLGWIFGLGKELISYSVFSVLKIFGKHYNMKTILGKESNKITLRDLIKFIEKDPTVQNDIKSNEEQYDLLNKVSKKYSKNKQKLNMFTVDGVVLSEDGKTSTLSWSDSSNGMLILGYLGIWTKEDKGSADEQMDKIIGIDVDKFDKWWNVIMGAKKIMDVELDFDRTFELVDGNVLKLVGKDWGKGKGKEEFITGLSRYDKKYGCRVVNFDELEMMVNLMVG